MRFLKTPEHQAIFIVWLFLTAWAGVAFVALGYDGWIPTIWPLLLALAITAKLLKNKRQRLAHDATGSAANISRKPSVRRRP